MSSSPEKGEDHLAPEEEVLLLLPEEDNCLPLPNEEDVVPEEDTILLKCLHMCKHLRSHRIETLQCGKQTYALSKDNH